MGRLALGAVVIGMLLLTWGPLLLGAGSKQPPPPEPTHVELQRQNAALRDSLAAERGWDTTPPGFIQWICEVQNE